MVARSERTTEGPVNTPGTQFKLGKEPKGKKVATLAIQFERNQEGG